MNTRSWFFLCLVWFIVSSCKKEKAEPNYGDFPVEVGTIMRTQCAIPGCHDATSNAAASGLDLSTWNKLFNGNRSGAVVIPYRADESILHFSMNTFSDLGIILEPTMPFGKSVLSRSEVEKVYNWINSGAPNVYGDIKFANDPNRRKYYVANQGCDLVTVFDAETNLQMRAISIGIEGGVESPHMLKVSPDGNFWYVVFLNSPVIQKFSAVDDSYVGEVNIGNGFWNTLSITHDSKFAFAVDWSSSGKIVYVNLETLSLIDTWAGFEQPHGSQINATDDTLYVTGQKGNFIYKIPVGDPGNWERISLVPGENPSTNPITDLDPHEIAFSSDGTKYFVTCQTSNEIRVFLTKGDVFVKAIKTPVYPQEMSFSTAQNYLFVTCPEDETVEPGKRGAVCVIDCASNTVIKNIHTGFQPHGLVVDEVEKKVYIANRNVNSGGPAPHHSSSCAGRNGYMTILNLNTLNLEPNYKVEVSVDPYSVALRN